MDEARISWIGSKGIEHGSREPEQFVIPEPVGRFQPVNRSIRVAEAGMDYREGERRSLSSSKKLIELAEKTPGLIAPAKLAVDVPQEGDRESFARKSKRVLKSGTASAPLCRHQAAHPSTKYA